MSKPDEIKADVWDEAHRAMCEYVESDGTCYLNPGYGHANPYRTPAAEEQQ